MLLATNGPARTGSVQAEVYFRKNTPDDLIEPVIKDLRRCGLLRRSELVQEGNEAPVCQHHFRPRSLNRTQTVHSYLDELGIAYCERYGEWATCESFKNGEQAAERALHAATCRAYVQTDRALLHRDVGRKRMPNLGQDRLSGCFRSAGTLFDGSLFVGLRSRGTMPAEIIRLPSEDNLFTRMLNSNKIDPTVRSPRIEKNGI
jgi:hypothetical protein